MPVSSEGLRVGDGNLRDEFEGSSYNAPSRLVWVEHLGVCWDGREPGEQICSSTKKRSQGKLTHFDSIDSQSNPIFSPTPEGSQPIIRIPISCHQVRTSSTPASSRLSPLGLLSDLETNPSSQMHSLPMFLHSSLPPPKSRMNTSRRVEHESRIRRLWKKHALPLPPTSRNRREHLQLALLPLGLSIPPPLPNHIRLSLPTPSQMATALGPLPSGPTIHKARKKDFGLSTRQIVIPLWILLLISELGDQKTRGIRE